MPSPIVSVIMPAFNAEAFIGKSVRSILGQEHDDLELIIVNDGSSDGTEAIIRGIYDRRIQFHTTTNQGVAHALNLALANAKGRYVARQDADDIAYPARLRRQLDLFRDTPDLVICGTWASIVREDGTPRSEHRHPVTDAAIRYGALFDSPFVSSSVMFRRDAVDRSGPFDADQRVFDDYDMWSRLLRVGKAANLPEILVAYREVGTSLSRTTLDADARRTEQRQRNLRVGFPEVPQAIVDLASHIGHPAQRLSAQEFRSVMRLFLAHIARMRPSPVERATMLRDLHRRMRGYQVNSMRVWDVLLKEILWRSTLRG